MVYGMVSTHTYWLPFMTMNSEKSFVCKESQYVYILTCKVEQVQAYMEIGLKLHNVNHSKILFHRCHYTSISTISELENTLKIRKKYLNKHRLIFKYKKSFRRDIKLIWKILSIIKAMLSNSYFYSAVNVTER